MSTPTPIWPDVLRGADGIPYVDREEDERPAADKLPVYHGEVSTPFTGGAVAFSLVVWTSTGGVFGRGEVLDLFLGYRTDPAPLSVTALAEPAPFWGSDALGGGSKATLSDLPPQTLAKPVVLVERSRAQGEQGETLLTLAGLVSVDVERLVIRAGGETRDVPLSADPLNAAHRLFVAFPPLDSAGEPIGTLVALAPDGSESWSRPIGPLFPTRAPRAGYASAHGG